MIFDFMRRLMKQKVAMIVEGFVDLDTGVKHLLPNWFVRVNKVFVLVMSTLFWSPFW